MDEEGSNWQDRCERYFTSLTDSDKQRQRDKKLKDKMDEDCWKKLTEKTDKSKRKKKVQYWFRALDIHGLHFAGSVRNSLECVVWVLLTIIACGALSFLLYLTVNGYLNQNNYLELKMSSMTYKNHPPTFVTVCNLNLFRKSSLLANQGRFSKLVNINSGVFSPQPVTSTEQLMKNSDIWSILKNSGVLSYASQLDQDFLPYSGMITSDDWGSLYGASMKYGFGVWTEAVRPTLSELKLLGHKQSDMIVECFTGTGGLCQLSVTEDTRTNLGNCATFNVSDNIDKIALILNSEPSESIPVLTANHGLSVQVYSTDSYYRKHKQHIVSPGKHLIIENKKVTSITREKDCFESTGSSNKQCEENCKDSLTFKYCQCHTDGTQNTQCRVNDKFEYVCSRIVEKLFYMELLNCKCKPECREIRYETASSTIPWPSSQHLEHLESLLQHKNFNKSAITSSLSYVTINLEPEVFEELKEEQVITLLDLLSRVGGLSAFVVGISILSVFQCFWLLIKLCFHAVISRRSDSGGEIENLANSDITSITWQAYKDKNNQQPRQPRFAFQQDFGNGLQRNGSRRSYLEPIEEERKRDYTGADLNRDQVLEDQLFSHPWERTGHRRPYSTVINSNRTTGGEFPLFNYVDNRSNSPLPRCSTPDNSDYRSTARLVPADGDVTLYPPKHKMMSPGDAIKSFGSSSSKYQYSGPFYL
ncbi:ENACD [Mytilus edulis]|uniref:SCNN1D n=1 Tax=Mytilus edulis TaxID=6550 RepID=A0A8S3SZ16_MYTED|nr:ENACD [Mytilus edulis]